MLVSWEWSEVDIVFIDLIWFVKRFLQWVTSFMDRCRSGSFSSIFICKYLEFRVIQAFFSLGGNISAILVYCYRLLLFSIEYTVWYRDRCRLCWSLSIRKIVRYLLTFNNTGWCVLIRTDIHWSVLDCRVLTVSRWTYFKAYIYLSFIFCFSLTNYVAFLSFDRVFLGWSLHI